VDKARNADMASLGGGLIIAVEHFQPSYPRYYYNSKRACVATYFLALQSLAAASALKLHLKTAFRPP
jgi:hypothetical protein